MITWQAWTSGKGRGSQRDDSRQCVWIYLPLLTWKWVKIVEIYCSSGDCGYEGGTALMEFLKQVCNPSNFTSFNYIHPMAILSVKQTEAWGSIAIHVPSRNRLPVWSILLQCASSFSWQQWRPACQINMPVSGFQRVPPSPNQTVGIHIHLTAGWRARWHLHGVCSVCACHCLSPWAPMVLCWVTQPLCVCVSIFRLGAWECVLWAHK